MLALFALRRPTAARTPCAAPAPPTVPARGAASRKSRSIGKAPKEKPERVMMPLPPMATPFRNPALVSVAVLCREILLMPLLPAWKQQYMAWKQPRDEKLARKLNPTLYPPSTPAWVVDIEPAPRTTAADRANDRTSTQRHLDLTLYLVVRGADQVWRFPQGPREEGEVMRVAAARHLRDQCGRRALAHFYHNAPCAHIAIPHDVPAATASSSVAAADDAALDGDVDDEAAKQQLQVKDGTIQFFYKAALMRGDVALTPASGLTEFAWLTRFELPDYLEPQVWAAIQPTLLPEVDPASPEAAAALEAFKAGLAAGDVVSESVAELTERNLELFAARKEAAAASATTAK